MSQNPDPAELTRRLGVDQGVHFETGAGGLTRAVIHSPLADAEVYLHGGHVTHWQPRGHQPVLFLSQRSAFAPGKPIRGGVPVCYPWFGPLAGQADAPMHGVVRLKAWTVQSVSVDPAGRVVLALLTTSDDASRRWLPGDFELRHTVTVGDTLTMTLETRNTGSTPLPLSEALHTYLHVSDIRKVQVAGLEGVRYVSKVEGRTCTQSDAVIRFTGETDRVYLDTAGPCIVDDPGLNRRITVDKSGSRSTVVWNPWIAKAAAMPDFGDDEWPGMLCVETANALENAVTVPAGGVHEMTARVSVG